MDAAKTVDATFASGVVLLTVTTNTGTGNGSVASSPPGIDCPDVTCQAFFANPTVVTLSEAPNAFSVFDQWTGAGSTNGSGQRVVTMDADKTVNAVFTLVPDLSATVSDHAGIVPDSGGAVAWTVVVGDNVNNEDPSGNVTITSVFAAGLTSVAWTCSASASTACDNGSGSGNLNETVTLPAGETLTFAVTATAPAGTGTLLNTATVSTDPAEVNVANNTATGAVRYQTEFNDGFESGTLNLWLGGHTPP
jgi:hypothetical protein